MRRFALVLLALAGGAALALGPASPAHAHAVLESSVPAGSSVLDTAPTDITLDFDEPVTVEPGAIRLLDSAGKQITLGPPERGTDASVVVSSVPDLKDGAYVVAWQVISQDGHPASGAFTFQDATRRFHKQFIEEALAQCTGNVAETARRIDVSRAHLYELIRGLGIQHRR